MPQRGTTGVPKAGRAMEIKMTSLAWVLVAVIALVVIGGVIGMPDIVIAVALAFLVMIALGGLLRFFRGVGRS
jgi:hypothetical protein